MKIKNCPFCGGKAELHTNRQLHYASQKEVLTYMVGCPRIQGGCNANIGMFDTEEEAINAWNRRYDD